MPKFARPNSYTGKQSNQQWTGDVRAATVAETAAGASRQVYISPSTLLTAFASPDPIGSTTPSTGAFTTLTATKQNYTSLTSVAAAGSSAAGTVALVAGTVVVSTTAVTATSRIRLTVQNLGTVVVPSAICCSARSTGVSFTILASQNTDTSTIFWEVIN